MGFNSGFKGLSQIGCRGNLHVMLVNFCWLLITSRYNPQNYKNYGTFISRYFVPTILFNIIVDVRHHEEGNALYLYRNVVSCVAALLTCSIPSISPHNLKDLQMRATNSNYRQRTGPYRTPIPNG